MEYKLRVSEHLDKLFFKISKKDQLQFNILSKKIEKILENPDLGKPLTANKIGQRRVHLGHFVLTYEVDEKNKIVSLLDYDHHDNIY